MKLDHVYNDYFKSTPFSLFLERNIKVDLPLPTLCSTPPSNSRPFVPPHHPHPPPPQPVIVETLLRGSSDNSTRTSRTDQSDLKPKPSLSLFHLHLSTHCLSSIYCYTSSIYC